LFPYFRFLFETKKKTILYTGDFRFCINDLPKMTFLHDNNKAVKKLDNLYLDTTFWNQANLHFPSRSQSLEMIVDSIDKFMRETANLGHVHIERPGKYFVKKKKLFTTNPILLSARIGSEYFMMQLSKRYGKKIHVNSDAFNVYQGIEEVMSCLTIDRTDSTFLHMCQSYVSL